MRRLAKDENYLRLIRVRDAVLEREGAIFANAEKPLVDELNKHSKYRIKSVDDLVNSKDKYPELVPTLLKHLDRDYPPAVREFIARALAVPAARVGWQKLVRCFVEEPAVDADGGLNEVKWGLHLAIAAAADLTVVDDLIRLAVDRRHGESRADFVLALANMKDPRAIAALEVLKEDPDLTYAIGKVFGKKKK